MKELNVGDVIETGYKVTMYVDGKEYKSHVIKTDGSYIDVHFRRLKITIPRVYTQQMKEPDENGIYFKVEKP